MELTQQRTLPLSQEQAWECLNDVQLLQECIPGCESLTMIDENQFEVVLVAAIGPVRARFKGRMHIQDKAPPQSYRLQFEGQGGAAGFGKGNAQVRLDPNGSHCELYYSVNASVGGKLAQIGSRLVELAARKLADQFFTRFVCELEARFP